MVVFECAFLLSTSLGSDALLEWAEPAAAERLLDWKVSHGAAPRQYHLHFLSSQTTHPPPNHVTKASLIYLGLLETAIQEESCHPKRVKGPTIWPLSQLLLPLLSLELFPSQGLIF